MYDMKRVFVTFYLMFQQQEQVVASEWNFDIERNEVTHNTNSIARIAQREFIFRVEYTKIQTIEKERYMSKSSRRYNN